MNTIIMSNYFTLNFIKLYLLNIHFSTFLFPPTFGFTFLQKAHDIYTYWAMMNRPGHKKTESGDVTSGHG